MFFLRNVSIGRRLGLGFGAIVVMIVIMAGVAWSMLRTTHQAIESVLDDRYPKIRIVDTLRDQTNQQVRNLRGAATAALLGDQKVLGETLVKVDNFAASSSGLLKKFEERINTPKGKELFKAMAQAEASFAADRDTAVKLLREGKAQEGATVVMEKVRTSQHTYEEALRAFTDAAEKSMIEFGDAAKAEINLVIEVTVGVAALVIMLSIFAAIVITKSITEPIRESVALARAVAAGDLSKRTDVKSGDEAGQLQAALRDMTDNLVRIVGSVRSGSDGVATASSQIAQGNQDLSARTESQASALQETAASMEELSSTVKQNADNAKQANQLAQKASTVAIKGGEVVSQVVETMKDINESSKKIADIISVIDGIAFQTNILALNAAVEAARAGEQGRGFAVVAGEVRSLAGRSAEAAKEIKSLITASVNRVEQGSELVNQAGTTMAEIVDSIRRVTDIMGEISAASSEQSSGVAQVGNAVTQMDQATQQNAALVEEMAAAASSLKGQAQELVQAMAVFNIGNAAATSVTSMPHPHAARAPEATHRSAAPLAKSKRDLSSTRHQASAATKSIATTELGLQSKDRSAAASTRAIQAAPQRSGATAGADSDWESF